MNRDDVASIDTNSDNRLSLLELTLAAQSGKFSGEMQGAVEGLRDALKEEPRSMLDKDHDIEAVIPSWQTQSFAKETLSADHFKLLDTNNDNTLSADELKSAEGKGLSTMQTHAAKVLLREMERNGFSTPDLIIHNGFINNWHELDPKLINLSDDKLLDIISREGGSKRGVASLVQLEKHAEFSMTAEETRKSISGIALLQTALKEGKKVETNLDGTQKLGEQPLSEDDRFAYHRSIMNNLKAIENSVHLRLVLGDLQAARRNVGSATTWNNDAISRADLFTEKIKTENNGEVRLVDLMNNEAQQLSGENASDPARRAELKADETWVRVARNTPIEARLNGARKSLGVDYRPTFNDKNVLTSLTPSFNTDSPHFNLNRAETLAKEGRALTIDLHGFDPANGTPAGREKDVLLFGDLWNELDPKASSTSTAMPIVTASQICLTASKKLSHTTTAGKVECLVTWRSRTARRSKSENNSPIPRPADRVFPLCQSW